MQDTFNEQLVKKSKSKQDIFLRVLMIVAGVVLTLLAITMFPSLGPILIIVIWFLVYLGMSFFNVEYEYSFTNGELDIDCIYNKSRRKRVFSCIIKDAEIFCHINDTENQGKFGGVKETKKFGSGVINDNTYMFLITDKGQQTKVIFEPNAKMLTSISRYLSPRIMKLKV